MLFLYSELVHKRRIPASEGCCMPKQTQLAKAVACPSKHAPGCMGGAGVIPQKTTSPTPAMAHVCNNEVTFLGQAMWLKQLRIHRHATLYPSLISVSRGCIVSHRGGLPGKAVLLMASKPEGPPAEGFVFVCCCTADTIVSSKQLSKPDSSKKPSVARDLRGTHAIDHEHQGQQLFGSGSLGRCQLLLPGVPLLLTEAGMDAAPDLISYGQYLRLALETWI